MLVVTLDYVDWGHECTCILYADHAILLKEKPNNLQKMLDYTI